MYTDRILTTPSSIQLNPSINRVNLRTVLSRAECVIQWMGGMTLLTTFGAKRLLYHQMGMYNPTIQQIAVDRQRPSTASTIPKYNQRRPG